VWPLLGACIGIMSFGTAAAQLFLSCLCSLLTVCIRAVVCRVVLCHAVVTVHRDVKPQNVMVSVRDKRVKLIDLGAAADLRLGINYVPNEYLLDPRWVTRH